MSKVTCFYLFDPDIDMGLKQSLISKLGSEQVLCYDKTVNLIKHLVKRKNIPDSYGIVIVIQVSDSKLLKIVDSIKSRKEISPIPVIAICKNKEHILELYEKGCNQVLLQQNPPDDQFFENLANFIALMRIPILT